MIGLFKDLKGYIQPSSCSIDNKVFRLHYKGTVTILIAFSLMVTASQYFGDPIDCISKDDIGGGDKEKILDTYCWIHTTFSIEGGWQKKVGVEVAYPGVDKTTPNEKKVYHTYYQWVCFVLFFQAILFYAPRFIWKSAEGKRTKVLVQKLYLPAQEEAKRTLSINLLVEYLYKNRNNHNTTFYIYVFSEVLNLVNVIGQMFLMDAFLGGLFLNYGWEVLAHSEWDWDVRYDPMIRVFPRMTKCTFQRFGSSGDVQKHDAMCILPLNIVNEKIYIFLWFWFYILAVITLIAVLYRLVCILVPPLRALVIQTGSSVDSEALKAVLKSCSIGDWFVLCLLAKNMDHLNFKDVIHELYLRFEGKSSYEM